jgi:putative resolvase
MDAFFNIGRAADFLGVSQASLRAWSNDGRLPVYRTPGGQRRYRKEDLEAFIASMRQPGARSAA